MAWYQSSNSARSSGCPSWSMRSRSRTGADRADKGVERVNHEVAGHLERMASWSAGRSRKGRVGLAAPPEQAPRRRLGDAADLDVARLLPASRGVCCRSSAWTIPRKVVLVRFSVDEMVPAGFGASGRRDAAHFLVALGGLAKAAPMVTLLW